MMCETLSGAKASGISMDTLGPMLLRLCMRFWIFLFWISLSDELSMPNDDLKSIIQKVCKHYSLLDRNTIDNQILKSANLYFNFFHLNCQFESIFFGESASRRREESAGTNLVVVG